MHNKLKELLSTKKEGLWWDFKQKFHENLFDLLHDITCLANVIHDGERYLIFGVSDNLEVTGLNLSDRSYTQADIIDYLRQQPFSENNIPAIELDNFHFGGKEVAILTISNERVKPYYFSKEIKSTGKYLRAGSIYSRVGDTNTPKNSCANPNDIKAMWFERFGLDIPAPKRFSHILIDAVNWNYNGVDGAYYELDPDYTIEVGETEFKGGQYWWQSTLIEQPIKYNYILKFKNTVIHELPVIHFQNENICIPFPEIEFLTYPKKKDELNADFYCDIFYYKKGTLLYSLLRHLRRIEIDDALDANIETPIRSQIKPPIIKLPFYIVKDDTELELLKATTLEKFKEFSKNRTSIMKTSIYKGREVNRLQTERAFAEWAHSNLKL